MNKNGISLASPTALPAAERREAERSEADRSAAVGKTVATPSADDPVHGARGAGGRDVSFHLLDPATGRSREIARSGRSLYLTIGMSVSPKGETILFAAAAETGADLMLVENFR